MHVGSWPLPLGGIAVHIQRLAHRCHAAGIEVEVFDPYDGRREATPAPFPVHRPNTSPLMSAILLLGKIWRRRTGWVHFHASRLGTLAHIGGLLLIARRGSSYAISVHGSFTHSWTDYGPWTRFNARLLLRMMDLVVVVNDEIGALLVDEIGVSPNRILVLPAYLPPISREHLDGFDEYEAIMRSHRRWRRDFDQQVFITGAPRRLYGFHLLLEAARDPRLAGVGFVFNHYEWSEGEPDYARRILTELRSAPNVFLVEEVSSRTFYGLLESSDAFVRATSQDGDSVALREAVSCGVAIVASDCVVRPHGAELFKTGDASDLAEGLVKVLTSDTAGRCEDLPDAAPALLEAYTRFART